MDMEKYILQKKINEYVNKGDTDKINEMLDNFEPDISFEEPELFADKIKQNVKGDVIDMKKKFKFTKFGVIAAVVAVISCASVSAAYILNTYTVEKDGTLYSVTSDQEIGKDELQNMVDEAADFDKSEGTAVPENEYEKFESIADAEKQYDMKILTPEVLPDLKLESITGLQTVDDEKYGRSTVWLEYGDTEDKAFGITVAKKNLREGETSISGAEFDAGTLSEYKSPKGYDFKILNESDEDGSHTAKIAYAAAGKYEYALIFMGFDEAEINKVIDSLDLSEYK